MPPDTPLNKAHQHASNAEDYINQGLFIPAAEEHYKSAEAFLQCVDQASDEGTKRTLRLLYNEHNKAGKELQRKIAKLRDEGKDPSLPQLSPISQREHNYASPSPGTHTMPPYVVSRGRIGESDHTIDESYMVLGQQQLDPRDTFNQFWQDLEGMLDNLSQPVAFATAPLAHFGVSEPASSRTHKIDASSTIDSELVRRERDSGSEISIHQQHRIGGPGQETKSTSNTIRTRASEPIRIPLTSIIRDLSDISDAEEVMADEDSPSGESFCMIPSRNSPSLATKLQEENDALKHQVVSLQQRLETAEQMRIEQEVQLRERILHARREAQRVKNSTLLPSRPTPSLDLSSLNINIPPIPPYPHLSGNRDREFQLTRRIKELEGEIKVVQLENEKQKAMITKFRERWEKLKESAKRKRNAKTHVGSDNNVREQRIDEEAEAEVAAEEGDAPGTLQVS